MKNMLWVALLTLVSAACAARSLPLDPVSDPALWEGDPRLYRILLPFPLGSAERDSLRVYERAHPLNTNDLLAEAADDPYAPVGVRANALLLLGERQSAAHLHVFRMAMDDEDPRVRATAAAAMREFAELRREDALSLARMALHDPHELVQAQALHIIGDTDPVLLRAFAARTTNAELCAVAGDLVRIAEERGAALLRDSATGVLRRETPHGITVTFTPRQAWPTWDAAVGDVVLARAGRTLVTLTEIEAVAGVVPVFFSADGGHAVFERARQVMVRDLESGAERAIGQGVAPRALPFTGDFIFLREPAESRTEMRHQTRIRYEVVRAPFVAAGAADVAPQVIGTTSASTTFDRHGNYSPARWMRVEERGGSFFLSGTGFELFGLPDPFTALGRDG